MSDLRCRGCDHELKPRTCVLYGCECECDNILQDDPTPEIRERILAALYVADYGDLLNWATDSVAGRKNMVRRLDAVLWYMESFLSTLESATAKPTNNGESAT